MSVAQRTQRVDSLPNVGPKLARALAEVGVRDVEDLLERGSVATWRAMREAGSFSCAMSLQALEGAVQGRRWHDLDKGLRAQLVALSEDPDGAGADIRSVRDLP